MTRLAHISDIHFGGENAPAVAAAAALVNESGPLAPAALRYPTA